ncbi:unnamed protein product [Lampetra fluviatilis]
MTRTSGSRLSQMFAAARRACATPAASVTSHAMPDTRRICLARIPDARSISVSQFRRAIAQSQRSEL